MARKTTITQKQFSSATERIKSAEQHKANAKLDAELRGIKAVPFLRAFL